MVDGLIDEHAETWEAEDEVQHLLKNQQVLDSNTFKSNAVTRMDEPGRLWSGYKDQEEEERTTAERGQRQR